MNAIFPPARLDTAAILGASRSSFIPAFRVLPADRRGDLCTLYAFCRRADDLADTGQYDAGDRRAALEAWRAGFRDAETRGLPENLRDLMVRRKLGRALFLELLEGVETDLAGPVRMANRAELDLYCHRVAGTVGQLCLPIFGADPKRAFDYAETLGRALQYTNILRDTGSDLRRGRLYYPQDELSAAGVDAGHFPSGAREYLQAFARGTEEIFLEAERLIPKEDRKALLPARAMASIYRSLLGKMRKDGVRVAQQRYRLSAAEKLWATCRALLAQ